MDSNQVQLAYTCITCSSFSILKKSGLLEYAIRSVFRSVRFDEGRTTEPQTPHLHLPRPATLEVLTFQDFAPRNGRREVRQTWQRWEAAP